MPIPLRASRFKKRGYNQSQLFAESLAQRFQIPSYDFLIRVKKTQPQFCLSKEDRDLNIKGAFALKKNSKEALAGKQVFLVDDVATSAQRFGKLQKY
jgi:predicted amidophosphoribosyltransferase